MQIVSTNEPDELTHLVRLGLAPLLLEVHQLAYAVPRKDAMAPAASDLLKPEGPNQIDQITKVDVANMTAEGTLKESARPHVDDSTDGVCHSTGHPTRRVFGRSSNSPPEWSSLASVLLVDLEDDLAGALHCPVNVVTTKEMRSHDHLGHRVTRDRLPLDLAARD